MLNYIFDRIRDEREYAGICTTLRQQLAARNPLPLLVTGMCDGARSAFYASLAADMKKEFGSGLLLIVPDEKEALKISNACAAGGLNVLTYPLRDFIFHSITASHEYEHDRLNVLTAVLNGQFDLVIATPDAALQFTTPPQVLRQATLHLAMGDEYPPERLAAFFEASGYARVDMVSGAGQYAVRGGIIDVFPTAGSPLPIRIEYFGDEVDSLSTFDLLSQRRIEGIPALDIPPGREILLSPAQREELKKLILAQIKKAGDDRVREILAGELEAVTAGGELTFIDKYISFVYPEKTCLMDYFVDAPVIITQEWNAVQDRLKAFEFHMRQSVTELLEEGSLPPKYAEFNRWAEDYETMLAGRASLIADTFASGLTGRKLAGIFSITAKQTVSYADNIELLREDLGYYLRQGFAVTMLCENDAMAKNLRDMLAEDDLPAVIGDEPASDRRVVRILAGENLAGFELTLSRFVVMSTYAAPGSYSRAVAVKKRKSSAKSAKERIMSYNDLAVGDYIVHANHGIGQYLGLESLTVEGVTKDFVKIKYAGTDMLYLPTNQLDMVSKYIGARSEDGLVKLSRMGGAEWGKAKSRAKAAARAMAKELIALYAERLRREGFAFPPDDEMQKDFDNAFVYEETDGQLMAIEEIKKDMERTVPMDRLLCGDVGYGKTEVALRAAFKAVNGGKQVAILVPTTILALQHYQTMLSRMRGFPVAVDMVSRFRTPKQQQETLRKLRRGEIDVIVGTHRLVSKDVEFKDLGLVIIDEEQRFGVAHKEKLKQISYNVDVLTLTATPIPRTLNMAMSGIRDMSILEEAPGDRMPVQTYVLEHDDVIIAEALKKELRRGGQVFYLHNRVETIDQSAARIQAMVPEARIATAHGQMDKEMLSDIWRDLVMGELDILISTTIIETGVDVPNANTLIIERADTMGLSQLHQLRGRVGRSTRRAYAYFTYPKGMALSEVAEKRLMAIRDFTEFGSGFKIAMRDLEIRGAGNLLGAEQHGHIDSVGYDLYMKLLNEAILEEKGETVRTKTDCAVDLTVNAYIPEKYIATAAQRIDAYKKIAAIETDDDYYDIEDELSDRYGALPPSVENLLKIAQIHSLGCSMGLTGVKQNGPAVIIRPQKMDAAVWAALAGEFKGKILLNVSSSPYISYKIKKDEKLLDSLCDLFKKYIQIAGK